MPFLNFKQLTLMGNLDFYIPDFVKVGFVMAGVLMCVFSFIFFVVTMIKHGDDIPDYDERTHGEYGQDKEINNLH